MRHGLRGAAPRLPGQVLDGLPGARQHGAGAAAGRHGRGQGELGLAERGHVTRVLTSDWLPGDAGHGLPLPPGRGEDMRHLARQGGGAVQVLRQREGGHHVRH